MGRASNRTGRWIGLCAGFALVVGTMAAPLSGQQVSGPSPTISQGSSGSGFLFSRPGFSLGVRGGMFLHSAGGELFDFVEDRFTLDGSDFRGISFGAEGAAWLGDRFELVAGVDVSRFTRGSEYRRFDEVLEDGTLIPIRQTTRLRVGPTGTLGLRAYLFPRGEQLGRFIWISRDWNVFAGAGIGATGYELAQWGDFVNEDTETIFTSELESDGYAGLAFVDAGLEVGITPRTALVFEARHQWADARLRQGFSRFQPVDLSGTRLTTGIRYRF